MKLGARVPACGSRGSTLIELLIVLLIFGAMLGGLAAFVRSSMVLERRLRAWYYSDYLSTSLEQEIARGLNKSSLRYAIPGVKLHPAGSLRDARGRLLHLTHPVHPASAALTFLHIEPAGYLQRAPKAAPGARSESRRLFCGTEGAAGPALSPSHDSWIAVTAAGYTVVQADCRRAQSRQCPAVSCRIAPLDQAMLHGRTYDPSLSDRQMLRGYPILALLPVRSLYTLYLDSEGILRRLSHISRDNQPIARGFAEITHYEKLLHGELRVLRTRMRAQSTNRVRELFHSLGQRYRPELLDAVY